MRTVTSSAVPSTSLARNPEHSIGGTDGVQASPRGVPAPVKTPVLVVSGPKTRFGGSDRCASRGKDARVMSRLPKTDRRARMGCHVVGMHRGNGPQPACLANLGRFSGRGAGDQLCANHFLELRDHFVLGAAFLIVPPDDRAVASVPAEGARRNVQALADGLQRGRVAGSWGGRAPPVRACRPLGGRRNMRVVLMFVVSGERGPPMPEIETLSDAG